MDELPDLSKKILYISCKGRPNSDVTVVVNAKWERVDGHLYIVGTLPKETAIVGECVGKPVWLRHDAIDSMLEFDSEEELSEKVFSGTSQGNNWEVNDAMYFGGIAIIFGNYIGMVSSEVGWIGWSLAMVGWYLKQRT